MGKFLNWSKKYEIGHPMIDLQHKELFDIINRLYENGGNLLIEQSCFRDLMNYAVRHFTTEEEIMRLYGYPEDKIVAHRKTHAKFYEKVQEFSLSSLRGKQTLEISIVYLKGWITSHVLDCDQDLAELVKQTLKVEG